MCLLWYLQDEDKLTADFAEYYHIYDWQSVPLETAATLAAELRPSSRSYMRAKNVHVSTTNALLARIHDDLKILICQHAGKRAQKPVLTADDLISGKFEQKTDRNKSFENSNDFESAWRMLNG